MNTQGQKPLYNYNDLPGAPTNPRNKEEKTPRGVCPNRDNEGYCKYKPDGKKYRCKGIAFENCDVNLKIKNGRIVLNEQA